MLDTTEHQKESRNDWPTNPQARVHSEVHRRHIIPFVEGDPLWTYNPGRPQHFISALINAVNMLSALEAHGSTHGNVNPCTVMFRDKITESNRTDQVYMIDLDQCRRNFSIKTKTAGNDSAQPPHQRMPIPPITIWFAAIETLQNFKAVKYASAGSQPVPVSCSIHHDLESLIWVAAYSLYRRAYEIANYSASGYDITHQEIIEDALNADFGNSDVVITESRRKAMASRGLSGLYNVLPYFDEELRDFVLGLMDIVHAHNRNVLPSLPRADGGSSMAQAQVELLTCESFRRYLTSYLCQH